MGELRSDLATLMETTVSKEELQKQVDLMKAQQVMGAYMGRGAGGGGGGGGRGTLRGQGNIHFSRHHQSQAVFCQSLTSTCPSLQPPPPGRCRQ